MPSLVFAFVREIITIQTLTRHSHRLETNYRQTTKCVSYHASSLRIQDNCEKQSNPGHQKRRLDDLTSQGYEQHAKWAHVARFNRIAFRVSPFSDIRSIRVSRGRARNPSELHQCMLGEADLFITTNSPDLEDLIKNRLALRGGSYSRVKR